ncbi:MAG: serine/threonine protein phosphatase [Planctomycetaceae bacterium]|nr:serine/threonine protein phosphatase [Planctomycetaceae bacterium]
MIFLLGNALTDRTIAIGDIHGCASALNSVLEAICPTQCDTIIQLGDAIDRGTHSRAVIDSLLSLSKQCAFVFVRGNHEELLLDALDDTDKLARWLRNGGTDTLRAYGCDRPENIPADHLEFLRGSVQYFESERHIFVHAGYIDDQPMAGQPGLALRWRVTNENSRPHCSGKTVITGHTAQKSGEILDLGHVKCIDTNCVHGGWLTAINADNGEMWQSDQYGKLRSR